MVLGHGPSSPGAAGRARDVRFSIEEIPADVCRDLPAGRRRFCFAVTNTQGGAERRRATRCPAVRSPAPHAARRRAGRTALPGPADAEGQASQHTEKGFRTKFGGGLPCGLTDPRLPIYPLPASLSRGEVVTFHFQRNESLSKTVPHSLPPYCCCALVNPPFMCAGPKWCAVPSQCHSPRAQT